MLVSYSGRGFLSIYREHPIIDGKVAIYAAHILAQFKPYIIIFDETQSGYISRRHHIPDVFKRQKLFVDLTPIMWHRVYMRTLLQEPVAFLKTPNRRSIQCHIPGEVFIRVSPILPSRDTKPPYNCARSRRGEYKRTSLTRIPLDRLGYKR